MNLNATSCEPSDGTHEIAYCTWTFFLYQVNLLAHDMWTFIRNMKWTFSWIFFRNEVNFFSQLQMNFFSVPSEPSRAWHVNLQSEYEVNFFSRTFFWTLKIHKVNRYLNFMNLLLKKQFTYQLRSEVRKIKEKTVQIGDYQWMKWTAKLAVEVNLRCSLYEPSF